MRPIYGVHIPSGVIEGVPGFADTPIWDNSLKAVNAADHHSRLQSLEAQMHSMRALLQDVVSAVCPEIRGSREYSRPNREDFRLQLTSSST